MDDYRRRPPMEGFTRPGQLGRGGEAWNDDDSVEGHIMDEERTDQVDTEGHAIRRRLDDEDTEGHGVFSRKATDDEEDTEGHGVFSRKATDDEEDTEGHGVFSRKATDEDEDDTEGHRINLK